MIDMIEMITIKNVKEELYLKGLEDNEPSFTDNIYNILSFNNVEQAEHFEKDYLNKTESYEIINLKIKIEFDETVLKQL
jgi:hypothetical protein